MKKRTLRRILQGVGSYVVFFLVVAFAVTCCMMLFVTTLAQDLKLTLTEDNLSAAAKLTFGNVMLLTLVFTLIDALRRKIMVERPVKLITQATGRIMQGDFSVRMEPFSHAQGGDTFNPIVDAVNNMARELAGTETLRSDFIANVSHELKTPLAVMANLASLLAQPGLTEQERQDYARDLSLAAQRQSSLISNILKLNKLENQQIFPQSETFDLSEQLRTCLLLLEDLWEQKKLDVHVDIPDRIMLTSDPELLALVWNNLLSNAVKFTPKGGTVSLSLTAQENRVRVTVADTGCGFGQEVGKRIFEKFYQGDPSRATAGNGLGLALVKRVVTILRAEISVESTVGQGSTFHVLLER